MSTTKDQRPARPVRAKAPAPSEENFRSRNAKLKREKMLSRLLAATMEVCADTQRRGAAVIDDVVRAAGVSRGAFYWYFDSLDEAIETLGRRLADDISAETYELFRDSASPADPVLGATIGGHVMLTRAVMDRVWSNYMSNIHILLDDSRFVKAVRHNLELGREQGRFRFESPIVALDFQIGAVMGAIRRCAGDKPPALSEMVEINVLILQGLGVEAAAARDIARQAERIVNDVGPAKLPWWKTSALGG
jgi:AcrR family transcriptional regulator